MSLIKYEYMWFLNIMGLKCLRAQREEKPWWILSAAKRLHVFWVLKTDSVGDKSLQCVQKEIQRDEEGGGIKTCLIRTSNKKLLRLFLLDSSCRA